MDLNKTGSPKPAAIAVMAVSVFQSNRTQTTISFYSKYDIQNQIN